jgi:hypothetical protein
VRRHLLVSIVNFGLIVFAAIRFYCRLVYSFVRCIRESNDRLTHDACCRFNRRWLCANANDASAKHSSLVLSRLDICSVHEETSRVLKGKILLLGIQRARRCAEEYDRFISERKGEQERLID